MKKPVGIDGSMDAELDSLLAVWAQSNALPEGRADAIQRAAKQDAVAKGAAALPVGLPSNWWFGFAHNLTGALTQASRSWSYAGRS